MKRIFTLLTAIILCTGMVVQAQGKILPKKPGQPIVQKSLTNKTKTPSVSNRRNAPQGPWTYSNSWSWNDFRTSSSEYKKLCSSGSLDAYLYDWINSSGFDIWIYLAFDRTKAGTYTYNNVNYVMPAKGSYTIQQNMEEWAMADWNAEWDGENYNESMFYDPGASNYNGDGGFYLVTGSANVTEGATGPYITISNVALSYGNGYGKYYDFGGGNSFTIGSPAVYRTVSVLSNSNTMGTVSYEVKSGYVYTYNITDWKNGSVYTLTAEPQDGYRFVCWKKGSTQISTNATTDVTIDGDAIYTAYFESAGPTFTLTLDVTSNGTVTVRDADLDNALVTFTNSEAKVGERHNISITATPATGYHLTSVTLGEELINNLNQTFEISEDITLSVVFEPDVYTITYKDKGNGEFTGTHGANHPTTHTYGTATALVNPTRESYTFGGWYTNSACTGAAITSIGATAYTSAPTLYAKWRGAITTSVSPSNYGTVTAGGTYDLNTNITLTATSANDRYYKFDHWLKDGNNYAGGATITPTVTANATYTAVFRQASNGTIVGIADHGTITGGGNYNGGDAVELEVTSDEGWYFTQWSDGNTENPRTVYVDGDHDYTAQFVEGVEIVDANGTYNVQGNYFEISGSSGDYSVLFSSFGVSTLQTGNYSSSQIWKGGTYVQYNGGDQITFTNRQATISRVGIMTWRLDATLSNATGPVYHLVIDVQKTLNGDYSSNINHTFTEGIDVYVDNTDDNIWWITTSGTWETVGWEGWWSDFAVYIDKTKQCGSNGIPSGIYTVAYPPSAGNVVPTISYSTDVNSSNPTYDGTIGGYYNNGYHNYFFPVSGTIEIINNNGSYYFNANLRNSRDKTLTESYGSRPSSYTVTVASNNNVLGSVQISTCGTGAVPNQTNKYYENTTLSLTAVPSGDNLFDHWELDGEEVEGEDETYDYIVTSSNAEIVAVFKKNTVYYTVTFKDYDGSTTLQTGDVEENTQPTIASDPTRADDVANNTAYTFAGWKSSADDNVYATANLPVATAAVTYTAQYEPYFLLLDDKADNNDPYYAALGDKKGEKLNVKYMRSFTKDTWAVFSLPFNYSFQNSDNNTFREQVYYLISAKYTSDGYLTLNCMPNTYRIEANKPYILIPKADIDNPTFKGVKMQSVAHNYYTAPNTEGIGTGVEFRNTTERETLARDKRVIYIKGANNQLYYPSMSVDTWMRPFRGYFYLNVTPEQIQYTPARVRLVTPEGEYIEQVPDTEEAATVETKKYIENGILVIERAGMKYDAQGHIIK